VDPALRPATHADADRLVGFMRELAQEGGPAFDGRPFDEPIARRCIGELIEDDRLGRIWLIEAAGEPVGYVVVTLGYSLEFHGRDALLDELFVAEHARGQGIGTTVLELVTAECRRLGVGAVHLEVDRANVKAQRLYRRHGYQDHDRYLLTRRLDI
jgi:ribosomal protein S18 acetylase RimI-like enzyme